MQILINGQWRQEADPISLADLLGKFSLQPRRVAVELNRQIVPRAQYAQTQLGEGDELEIVTLVGGG
jgi:thiamine biosynthesis protein ThiS